MDGVLIVVFASLGAFLVSWLAMPLAREMAYRLNALALPNHRTIHASKIPKLGGVAILAGFIFGVFWLWGQWQIDLQIVGLAIGGVMVSCLGFFDDIYVLSCYRKLFVQALAAALAIYLGLSFESLAIFGMELKLGAASAPISAIWIIGLMNALNLIDGVDGLASGFSILVALLLSYLAFANGDLIAASVALTIAAASVGFLRYNLPPASMFMGDTGSLFLGFVLACLSVRVLSSSNGSLQLVPALLIFSYPVTDMVLAVIRRIRTGQHPFWADRKHIHHRLLDAGIRQSVAVVIILAGTAVSVTLAAVILLSDTAWVGLSIIPVGAIFARVLYGLGCFNLVEREYRGLRERPIRLIAEEKSESLQDSVV